MSCNSNFIYFVQFCKNKKLLSRKRASVLIVMGLNICEIFNWLYRKITLLSHCRVLKVIITLIMMTPLFIIDIQCGSILKMLICHSSNPLTPGIWKRILQHTSVALNFTNIVILNQSTVLYDYNYIQQVTWADRQIVPAEAALTICVCQRNHRTLLSKNSVKQARRKLTFNSTAIYSARCANGLVRTVWLCTQGLTSAPRTGPWSILARLWRKRNWSEQNIFACRKKSSLKLGGGDLAWELPRYQNQPARYYLVATTTKRTLRKRTWIVLYALNKIILFSVVFSSLKCVFYFFFCCGHAVYICTDDKILCSIFVNTEYSP